MPARPQRKTSSRCMPSELGLLVLAVAERVDAVLAEHAAASRRPGSAAAAGRRGTSRACAGRRSSVKKSTSRGCRYSVDGKLANVTSASGSSWWATSTSSSMKRSTRARPEPAHDVGRDLVDDAEREAAPGGRGTARAASRTARRPLSWSSRLSRKQRCFDQGTSTKTLSPKACAVSRNARGGTW